MFYSLFPYTSLDAYNISTNNDIREQIEVRELVTLLQAHHKLSADTIRSNIMAILRDSAVIKKGIIKYVKGISKFVPPCQIQMT